MSVSECVSVRGLWARVCVCVSPKKMSCKQNYDGIEQRLSQYLVGLRVPCIPHSTSFPFGVIIIIPILSLYMRHDIM